MSPESKTPFGHVMYVVALVLVGITYGYMSYILLAFTLPAGFTPDQLKLVTGFVTFFLVVATFDRLWWPVLCKGLPEHIVNRHIKGNGG